MKEDFERESQKDSIYLLEEQRLLEDQIIKEINEEEHKRKEARISIRKNLPKNKEDKLDIQGIKNKLKIRFPELEWFNRTLDGVPTAQMEFMDGSACDFTIGDQANHLTLTYWKKDPNKQVDPIKDGN